ncbi:MAG: RNA pyrophosphohydrolase [Spirochaetia bacterium]|nr:RNA pyrophosphohydrolase [Spirochaetia bacterium]
MEDKRPYRKNVGVVVYNEEGMVLTGERIQYPGIFQFPQGGMDEGETPLETARRELYEETSLKLNGEPTHEIQEWIHYDFPEHIPEHLKKFKGQAQKWFFFPWDGDPSTLILDLHEQEFLSVRWYNLYQLVDDIVVFKKMVYRRILEEAEKHLPKIFTK